MDVDSAREDTRDVLEVSGEIQEKPSGRQGDRDWHYDEERYEDADHFSAVERREVYNTPSVKGVHSTHRHSVTLPFGCLSIILTNKRVH